MTVQGINFPARSNRPVTMSLRSALATVAVIAVFLVLLREPIAAMFDTWQWDRFNRGFYGGFWWAGLFDSNWKWVWRFNTGEAAVGALVGGIAAMLLIIVLVVVPAFATFSYLRSRSASTRQQNDYQGRGKGNRGKENGQEESCE